MRAWRLLCVVLVVTASFGLCVQAQATGFVCGMQVTANYTLPGDESCPGQSGIVVGANGITIDLGGHTLSGDQTNGTNGIDDSGGFDNVTVRDGTVTKFYDGVHGSYADGMHVQGVLASGNGSSGIFVRGNSASVSSSQGSGNSYDGIYILGDSARVSSSQALGNRYEGINIHGSSIRVFSSQASGNGLDGIDLFGTSVRIRSSTASGNGEVGIGIWGDAPKIGQLPGRRRSDRNHADADGFRGGYALGIYTEAYTTTAPVGRNEASGNEDPMECNPVSLC